MTDDKIPPMFDNLHGSVHNELGPTKRASKEKFVKNKNKIPATPDQLLNPAPPMPHDDSETRRVPNERIVVGEKNYCNAEGECTNKEWDMSCCTYCVCGYTTECVYLEFGDECTMQQAKKEAGVK